MKKQTIVLIALTFACLTFIAVGALTAADIPDNIKIENQGYAKDKKGAVNLSHKKHSAEYKIACNECHHVYQGGKNVWKEGDAVKKCSECHNPENKEGNADKLMNAFHGNCKECHKKVAAEGKDKAPSKKCNDCHASK